MFEKTCGLNALRQSLRMDGSHKLAGAEA